MNNQFIAITITDFIFGMASSFLASILFIICLLVFLRPRLRISHLISKLPNAFESSPANMYVFKFYNASWFDGFDVDLILYKVENYDIGNGIKNERYKGLKLQLESLKHLPKYKRITDAKDKAPHCLLFRTIESLEYFFEEGNSVELQITLKHGISGLSRVFNQRYNKTHLKAGHFQYGNNLDII